MILVIVTHGEQKHIASVLASVTNFATRGCHLHQLTIGTPSSTTRDRTPGTPGSDKMLVYLKIHINFVCSPDIVEVLKLSFFFSTVYALHTAQAKSHGSQTGIRISQTTTSGEGKRIALTSKPT